MKYLSFAVFCLINSVTTAEAKHAQSHSEGVASASKAASKDHKGHKHHKSLV